MVVGDGNNARLEEASHPSLNRYVTDGPRRIAPSPPQSVHGHYPLFPRNSELPFVLLILQAGEGGSLRRYLLHSMLIDEHGNRMVAARLCRSRWNKLRRLAAY